MSVMSWSCPVPFASHIVILSFVLQAFRIEPLVNPSLFVGPVLMPHHKGRKRLHLGD